MRRCLAVLLCVVSAAASAGGGVRVLPQQSGVDVRLRGISAVDSGIAWASGARGTVLRTLDGGSHWRRLAVPGADELDFRDVEGFDAQTAVVLAIGPGEASRVYRTEDGGESWQLALQNRDPRAFFDCMVFEGEHGWLLGDPVEGRFQVHATDDGGRSWRLLSDGPRAAEGEAAFAASGTCIARAGATLAVATGGSRSAVHVRRDGESQWRRVASGFDAGAESKGVFSLAGMAPDGFIAVGGDFRAETAPASAAKLAAGAPGAMRSGNEDQIAPRLPADAGFDVTSLPATPGYRSGVACTGAGVRCVAVGPSGVDSWNGEAWKQVSATGYDAIDIKGHVGWSSGDGGRIARIEIGY